MFDVILFDLDGTLVPMDMEAFTKAYFESVCARFARMVPPDNLMREILRGTMMMVNDLDPARTNCEVFWAYFSQRIGMDAGVLIPLFEDYYSRDFPHLKSMTRPNPRARPVMEALIAKGFRVGIATNPVFPTRAVEERLRWVDVADMPFCLVTTYENMHFCKPRIEYYKEVADILGVLPERCLMVGNDVEEDLAARKIGMKTFLVEDCLLNTGNLPVQTDYRGSFQDMEVFVNGLECTRADTHVPSGNII